MTDAPNRDRFIQFRKTDIIAMCCDDSRMDAEDVAEFREFCRILEALFHFEFHGSLETLKNCYAPFNPDADTRPLSEYLPEHKDQLQKELVAEMTAVLNSANFEKITAADLEQALAEESLFKIRLEVDFDDFEDVIFFRRGESVKQETLATLYGLRKKCFNFTNYDRVAVYIKFKEKQYTENRPMAKGELDDLIEKWFENRWNCRIDFEIDDALKKLERLELVTREGNVVQCRPLSEAKRRLDYIWDNYFTFNSNSVPG